MSRIRVAVVDDHAIVRLGLECAIGAFRDFEFAGAHPDGDGAAAFVARVKSDVTLLDIRMPRKDGITALQEILLLNPAAKVVMLTTVGTEEDVFRALKLGAKGYVVKDGETEEIARAVRTVFNGGTYMSEDARQAYAARCGHEALTARETEALQLLAEGKNNGEIAEIMGVSRDGVKNHFRHISGKLGTRDRVETIAVALRRGLIHAE